MANAVPGRGSDGNTDGRRQAISLAHIGFVSQNKVARKLPSCDVGRWLGLTHLLSFLHLPLP